MNIAQKTIRRGSDILVVIVLLCVFYGCGEPVNGVTDVVGESKSSSEKMDESAKGTSINNCEAYQRFAKEFECNGYSPCAACDSLMSLAGLKSIDLHNADSLCAKRSIAIVLGKLYLGHLERYNQGMNLYDFDCPCVKGMIEFMRLSGIENSKEVISTSAIIRLDDSLYLQDPDFKVLKKKMADLRLERYGEE